MLQAEKRMSLQAAASASELTSRLEGEPPEAILQTTPVANGSTIAELVLVKAPEVLSPFEEI